MKNKFTTIKLRFDVSTIIFENPEQTTEKIVWPSETFSFAQLSNYQFPTVEEILDEGEPELPTISSKKGDEIQEAVQEITVPSNELLPPSETPFEIKMIATAPFFYVCKQKKVKLFSASLKDIKKTSNLKVVPTQPPNCLTSSTNSLNCFLRKKPINCLRTAFMTTKFIS